MNSIKEQRMTGVEADKDQLLYAADIEDHQYLINRIPQANNPMNAKTTEKSFPDRRLHRVPCYY